jgi:hypothetical protein
MRARRAGMVFQHQKAGTLKQQNQSICDCQGLKQKGLEVDASGNRVISEILRGVVCMFSYQVQLQVGELRKCC